MSKPQRSPREEREQAKRSKQAKRDRRKKRGRAKKASSSSEGEHEAPRQSPTKPPPRRSPRIRAPAPAAAPAPAPAPAAEEESSSEDETVVVTPVERDSATLRLQWLRAAGRVDEAEAFVHPFPSAVPDADAEWAKSGFAPGWQPGWGWDAVPKWLQERLVAQGFDPTVPANVQQLEKECAICKKYNLRPHCPFSMLSPTAFGRRLLARAEVATDPARAAQLRTAQEALSQLRHSCEKRSNPGALDRERYGCCESCGLVCTFLLRKVGPEVLLRVTGKDYAVFGFVRGRLVNGKVVLENLAPHDAKLINDHLEWSATHRMWARRSASSVYCSFDVLYLGVQDLQSKCDPGLRHPRRRLDRRPTRLEQCPIGASRPKSPIDLHAGALVLALHEPGRRHPDQRQLLSAGRRSI